jgi:hypothetical protein
MVAPLRGHHPRRRSSSPLTIAPIISGNWNNYKIVEADACRVVALGAETGEEAHHFRFTIYNLRVVYELWKNS